MPYCIYCSFEDADRFCGRCGRPQGDQQPRTDVDYDAVAKEVEERTGNEGETVLFEGTTWPLWCLSPLFCSPISWRISSQRIDWDHGCCAMHSDNIDLRRIKDMACRRNPIQTCLGRATIYIYTDAKASNPVIKISKFGARKLYRQLVQKWTDSQASVTG